ncbi:MAG: outer membrane protein assembly factor BamE [Fimbriimonadaceae bacterium]|nr:outer membrane protein assembly factor BamE [Alphaproteobacteria bacterium]
MSSMTCNEFQHSSTNSGCGNSKSRQRPVARAARIKPLYLAVFIGASSLALTACGGGLVTQHGYVASESALEQIQIGSSKEQVRLIMGTPTAVAAIDDRAYFYVSEIKKQLYFFEPKTIDRRVLTFHFDDEDRVARIANYGLKDGVVFDFISRTTPTRGDELTALRQIFGNLGNFGAGN